MASAIDKKIMDISINWRACKDYKVSVVLNKKRKEFKITAVIVWIQ